MIIHDRTRCNFAYNEIGQADLWQFAWSAFVCDNRGSRATSISYILCIKIKLPTGLPRIGLRTPENEPPVCLVPLIHHKESKAVSEKDDRDIEKQYTNQEFVEKIRRLADSIESGENFEIQIAGERIYVPNGATFTIEHERSDGEEEVEFQIKWSS